MTKTPNTVELPAGGPLTLRNAEEVEMWESAAERYIDDYGLVKANDLMLLGAILSQGLVMYRAQQQLSDEDKSTQAQNAIKKASEEIRELEKALGIDKKSREAGGHHTVADYITRLKKAAHLKGVHLSERTKRYEKVMMEARWKIRLLRNGDEEDKRYHGITEAAIIDWLEQQLGELEEADKKWAREKGALFVGQL